MKIYFATHNPGKVKEFKEILKNTCEVEQIEIEYSEIQSSDPEEVAQESAKMLAEEHKKPVVVEDSGLFIDALNGFPGVYSAPIHKQIGLAGILKLMKGEKNRTCSYKSAVGYCEPGAEPITFLGVESGTLAESEKGENGFGHDSIFIPQGSSKTYGEHAHPEKDKKFRRRAIEHMIEWMNNRD